MHNVSIPPYLTSSKKIDRLMQDNALHNDITHSVSYRLMQWMFFPLVLLGTPSTMYGLIQNGISVPVATYTVILLLGLIYWVFEWRMPYRRHWNQPQGDVGNDVISGTVAYIVMPIFLKPMYIALLAGGTAWLAQSFGSSLWPSDWPIVFQVILLLLLGDAGRYWGHRLAHTLPFLWRFHAVHHSAQRLWWWNATRQHPVDKAWFTFTEMLFPVLIGAEGTALALYLGVTAVCGFAQHCNIDIKLGPLYWIFNVVDLHRWHHSKKPEESDNNYGNNLIIYDLLFGTYYHPERQERVSQNGNRGVGDIGLLNPQYPKNYLGQLAAPFKKGLDKTPS